MSAPIVETDNAPRPVVWEVRAADARPVNSWLQRIDSVEKLRLDRTEKQACMQLLDRAPSITLETGPEHTFRGIHHQLAPTGETRGA